jgi:predicted transcriptional regulator
MDEHQIQEHSDTLAHLLSELVIELEVMRVLWSHDPHQAYAILEQARQTSRDSLSIVRTLLRDLHKREQPGEPVAVGKQE